MLQLVFYLMMTLLMIAMWVVMLKVMICLFVLYAIVRIAISGLGGFVSSVTNWFK